MEFVKNQAVRHKKKKLHDAKFYDWSKSGKRVGVMHNAYHPWGVRWVVNYFKPESIESYEYNTH
jgi:hypothetical protein